MRIVACLTVLALLFGAVSAQTPYGDWQYYEWVDPFTDEVTAQLVALPSQAPPLAASPALYLTCSSDTRLLPIVTLIAGRFITTQDRADVIFRVDKEEPHTSDWYVTRGEDGVMARGGARSHLVPQLYDATELVIRVEAFRESFTYFLPVQGLRQALRETGCFTGHGI